jgi:F-type H+-transporting ATPase subunit delta
MRPSTTARRYAEAAFDVAQADGNTATWLRDLDAVSRALHDQTVASFFKDPKISREEKLSAIGQIFGSAQAHVANLLRLLTSQGRMFLVPQITQEFATLYRQAQGVTEATVTVARPVNDAERQEISRRLEAATGKKVELNFAVDPSILGGIIIRLGDQLIDASVAGRLERLRQQLAV